ncbi:MAG: cation transporter [Acidimicrobiia bacterium]
MTATTVYSVPGVSCEHCRHAIETSVGVVPGVEHVTVDLDAKTVTIAGSAPDDAMRAAIDDAGYDVAD